MKKCLVRLKDNLKMWVNEYLMLGYLNNLRSKITISFWSKSMYILLLFCLFKNFFQKCRPFFHILSFQYLSSQVHHIAKFWKFSLTWSEPLLTGNGDWEEPNDEEENVWEGESVLQEVEVARPDTGLERSAPRSGRRPPCSLWPSTESTPRTFWNKRR